MKRGIIFGCVFAIASLFGAVALDYSTQGCAMAIIALAAVLGLVGTAIDRRPPPTLGSILHRYNYTQRFDA